MKKITRPLTFANVVACLALFVALGGASYAAFKLPKNSVGAEAVENGLPPDGAGYLRLVAGLVAVEERHPELIESLRTAVLEPRRAVVVALIEREIERADLRADLDPVAAVDFIAGSYLARALAGLDTGPRWRSKAFAIWWEDIRNPALMVSSQTS
jgi:hypothetical protein